MFEYRWNQMWRMIWFKTSLWLIFLSLDQTLQDIICTVEDYDHQEPPSSSPVPSTTAGNQQMEDAKPQDEDSPPRPSSGDTGSKYMEYF